MGRSEKMKKNRILIFLASGFFISHLPVRLIPNSKFSGAGLWGSMLAFMLAPLLPENIILFSGFLALFLAAALWLCGQAERVYGTHDDPRIVIDEIAGYWVSIAYFEKNLLIWIAALAAFRFFDTVKPWPIKKLDGIRGGFGILADDVAAGILANLTIRVFVTIAGLT